MQLYQQTANIMQQDCLKMTDLLLTGSKQGIVVNFKSKPETCLCTICSVPLSRNPLRADNTSWNDHGEMTWEDDVVTNRNGSQQKDNINSKLRLYNNALSGFQNSVKSFFKMREDRKLLEEQRTGNNNSLNNATAANPIIGGLYSFSLESDDNNTANNNLANNQSAFSMMAQWAAKSRELPNIEVFLCGHYYHQICYLNHSTNINKGECIRCCPSLMKKRK
ncbi:hypothetical protein RFI_24879 [Reticulomyxa filosa]|uniref:Uncharacterized protein n=1 Tax=Reticulomyxa filosa TaxID=46433 RepID=X6MHF9_RETFI|nr:hypothetical protein RFI_24879 [Reticulomyxa filosa]|eukprot:ETO12495.1 hypothetical protein RFI_24879 [Reticulomyxa filosa]